MKQISIAPLYSGSLLIFAIIVITIIGSHPCNAQSGSDPAKLDDKSPHLVKVPTSGYVPAATSAESKRGQALFQNVGCMSCHSVHNVGGDLAPMLDGVGARRSEDFMIAHLSNSPAAIEQYRNMRGKNYISPLPHSRYSLETVKALVAYLKTIPEPPDGFVIEPHVPRLPASPPSPANQKFKPEKSSDSSIEGEKLFNKRGCVACHAVGDVGGWLAPRLDGVGGRRSREFIQAHVTDAQAHAAALSTTSGKVSSKMPRLTLSPLESKQITDYLMTLPDLSGNK